MRLPIVMFVLAATTAGIATLSCDQAELTPDSARVASLNEVKAHNTEADCWIAIGDGVYDVTRFIASHSGGAANMSKYCGKNGSSALASHSEAAKQVLSSAKVASYDPNTSGTYTVAEVAERNGQNNADCWMIIELKNSDGTYSGVKSIFDFTNYMSDSSDSGMVHQIDNSSLPTGSGPAKARRKAVRETFCGKNATGFFYQDLTKGFDRDGDGDIDATDNKTPGYTWDATVAGEGATSSTCTAGTGGSCTSSTANSVTTYTCATLPCSFTKTSDSPSSSVHKNTAAIREFIKPFIIGTAQ